jgi:catechol 2,3-dioxygenase-like lactoylglutathione lyase family enzyme
MMFAHIKHAAIYTQNPGAMIAFYERILGMKRITTAVTEANRGHISDGLIGLAVLARRPGIPGGLDHFGFEVDDIELVLQRIRGKYPETIITKGLEKVPFAVFRSHDPAGAQFDISERTHEKVREGYKEDGWDQPRQFNHVVIRAAEPRQVAGFYQDVFELFEVKEPPLGDAVCLSDGKVRLLVLPTNNSSYISMRQGLDHIGFKVESLEEAKKDLEALATSAPASAPKDIGAGIFGHFTKKDMESCKIGQYALADPDGVLLDFSEN